MVLESVWVTRFVGSTVALLNEFRREFNAFWGVGPLRSPALPFVVGLWDLNRSTSAAAAASW